MDEKFDTRDLESGPPPYGSCDQNGVPAYCHSCTDQSSRFQEDNIDDEDPENEHKRGWEFRVVLLVAYVVIALVIFTLLHTAPTPSNA